MAQPVLALVLACMAGTGHKPEHSSPVQVQQVLEFSSDRGRMSVIFRSGDGTIRLFSKGSDAKMMRILAKATHPSLVAATDTNLHGFAKEVQPRLEWRARL